MNFLFVFLLPWCTAFQFGVSQPPAKCKNSEYILGLSQQKYDAAHQWGQSELKLHIQEPRVGNPHRYSRVILNNASNYFEVEREEAEGRIKRVIDEQGSFQVLLNESAEVPVELQERYGLNQERSEGYRNFYRAMYGLPMSISESFYTAITPAEPVVFEGEQAYKISLKLAQEMISKHWGLIISSEDHSLLALELYDPDDPQEGELIKFEGEIQLDGLSLPRIRHWYEKSSSEYLGSDIIVETLE